MTRHLSATLAVAALSIAALSPLSALATAGAVRLLPVSAAAAASSTPIVINRLSAVTSDDGKEGVVAWDIGEEAGVTMAVNCHWASSGGTGKAIVSWRPGFSHRVTCNGKTLRLGPVPPGIATAEFYYSGASQKGLNLNLTLTTPSGFVKPNGQEVVPSITFNMSNSSSVQAASSNVTSSKTQGPSNAIEAGLIPASVQNLLKQSPFYQYLQGSGFSDLLPK